MSPRRRKLSETTKDELLQLDKEELAERVIQYQKHNTQLKNILQRDSLDLCGGETSRKRPYDFTTCHYRRVLIRIMYFGWNYGGFVVQEDTPLTIENYLFQALIKACLVESREKSQYHRCGRTDKGVSAFGQVISLTIRSKHPPEDQYKTEAINSEIPYCTILNKLLPDDIKAIAWMPIPADKPNYSARFNCKKRQYRYYFPRSTLDFAAMKEACAHLVGKHDFRNLCKMDVGNGVVEFTREIFSANILPFNGEESDDRLAMYYLMIESNGFLWHQIRCIMAVLLLVGQGEEKPDIIKELLDVKKNSRKPQYDMAAEVPLNLSRAFYDIEENNDWVYAIENVRHIIMDLQKSWTLFNIKTTIHKDCIDQLDAIYWTLQKEKSGKLESEQAIDKYTNSLYSGFESKFHRPLLERPTCASLEERIEQSKRRKAAKRARWRTNKAQKAAKVECVDENLA